MWSFQDVEQKYIFNLSNLDTELLLRTFLYRIILKKVDIKKYTLVLFYPFRLLDTFLLK